MEERSHRKVCLDVGREIETPIGKGERLVSIEACGVDVFRVKILEDCTSS